LDPLTNELKRPQLEEVESTTPQTLKPGNIPDRTQPKRVVSNPVPRFQLPNCKVGQAYNQRLECDSSDVKIIEVEIPSGVGLTFDPRTSAVVGTPAISGDIKFTVFWHTETHGTAKTLATTCTLVSNPEPKSLWKVIEPDKELPFPKAHRSSDFRKCGGRNLLAASRRGRSHEHAGTFRDDDFGIELDDKSGWSILSVADGAGSAEFSREGSRIAVEASIEYLNRALTRDFVVTLDRLFERWSDDDVMRQIGSEFHYLFHGMASKAVQEIEAASASNFVEPRQFSTTLLVALIYPIGDDLFIATFWMGDGAIAAYGPKGTVKVLGVPDGGEYAGQTRFLDRSAISDMGFGKRVRIGKLSGVEAVMLMTDGVSDPCFETDNGLIESDRWDCLWAEIEPKLKGNHSEKDILEWLNFFVPGHHDDRTIAIWW
jgi:hypothetical protein